jgi:hypothetical protein
MPDQNIIPIGRFKPKHFVHPDPFPGKEYIQGEKYELKNMKTGDSVMAEFTGGIYRMTWAETPDSFCLVHFDLQTHKLKAALETAFPALIGIERMRFLIMREI